MAMVTERLDWLLSRNGKLTERSGKKTKGRGSSFIRFFLLTYLVVHYAYDGYRCQVKRARTDITRDRDQISSMV